MPQVLNLSASCELAQAGHFVQLQKEIDTTVEREMSDDKYISKFREIEFKYSAESIKLKDYLKLAESLNPVDFIEVGSWDYYFSAEKTNFNFEFIRYRQGPRPELTIKVKLNEKNNNDRVEIDVPLDPNRCTLEDVSQFCEQLGFKVNVAIYKVCYIHYYKDSTLVYYVVLNEEMKEVGRYIEVEARKDIHHESEQHATDIAKNFEKELSILGITPQHRIKKSQWELNRK